MPNEVGEVAIEEIASLLAGLFPVVELTKIDLAYYGNSFKKGWSIPNLFEDASINLRLLIPDSFPFSPPRIGIWPKRALLSWPHLEEYGLLCLLSNQQRISPERPRDVVVYLLEEARRLVNECLTQPDQKSFRDEFISYWCKWVKVSRRIISLVPPREKNGVLSALDYGNFTIISDNAVSLCQWVEIVFKNTNNNHIIYDIPYIWLREFPTPAEYPSTVPMLRALIASNDNAIELLESFTISKSFVKPMTIIFGSKNSNGSAFGGLALYHIHKFDPNVQRGQRQGRKKSIPVHPRITTQIDGIKVIRCDPGWVHGRDQNLHITDLRNRHVYILGIGSVGSGVAQLLTKSGVGRITLVDPDSITSENIGRHELGIGTLWDEKGNGVNKATALASQLKGQFPHANITGIPEAWQIINKEDLYSADIIISTIGVWSDEAELNQQISKHSAPPPIIFGWTEPHAVAGHGILIMPGEGCLRCIVDEMGMPKTPVAEIPKENVLKPIPACGGHFQPYGAVELSYIQSLLAELCLSVLIGEVTTSRIYSWIGCKSILASVSGKWNPIWVQKNGDPGEGGKINKSTFVRDPNCSCCGS